MQDPSSPNITASFGLGTRQKEKFREDLSKHGRTTAGLTLSHLPVTLLFQKKLIDLLAVEFYSGEILVSYEQGFPVEFLTVHDHPMALKLQY